MQLIVNIIVLAAIYALIACGYVLVYRVSRVLNLAHGELMMLGAYLLFRPRRCSPAIRSSALAVAVIAQPRGRDPRLRPADAEDDRRDGARRHAHHGRARHPVARRWSCCSGRRRSSTRCRPCGSPIRRSSCPAARASRPVAALVVLMTAAVYAALFPFLRFGRWGVRMRAAGQNPLLAAQRGINLHAIYALAWGLSTLTGSLAGMLIALDSGLDQTMVIIGLKAFPAGAGRRARQPGRRARRLADRRRRRGAGHPLRRSAARPTWCRSSC